jgi:hypothetical protein
MFTTAIISNYFDLLWVPEQVLLSSLLQIINSVVHEIPVACGNHAKIEKSKNEEIMS